MGFQPAFGVFNRRNVAVFYHRVTLGATGALSSQDAANVSGVVCSARISAGRYTLTVPSKYRRFLWGDAQIIGTNAAAYTAAKGIKAILRGNDIDANNADGTIELQFVRGDTNADADVDDNLTFMVRLEMEV